MRRGPNKRFPYTLNVDDIPTAKLLDVTPEPGRPITVCYACPDACWREHLDEWRRHRRDGNKTAPEPMPYGHLMFDRPTSYGRVPYGCTDPEMIRKAHEAHVRGMLHGWDEGIPSDRLEAIVKATVDARMAGVDTGASPFMACIAAGM